MCDGGRRSARGMSRRRAAAGRPASPATARGPGGSPSSDGAGSGHFAAAIVGRHDGRVGRLVARATRRVAMQPRLGRAQRAQHHDAESEADPCRARTHGRRVTDSSAIAFLKLVGVDTYAVSVISLRRKFATNPRRGENPMTSISYSLSAFSPSDAAAATAALVVASAAAAPIRARSPTPSRSGPSPSPPATRTRSAWSSASATPRRSTSARCTTSSATPRTT